MSTFLKNVQAFFKTDFGTALLIVLIWKIVMTIIGFIIDAVSGGAINLFDHTVRWDGEWYTIILNDHYTTNLTSTVFYPLFPVLVGVVDFLSFNTLGSPLAAQLVNTVAVWFALIALVKLSRKLLGENKKFWLVALVLSAPTAFFLHTFYGEAVFLALSLWAYYFALTRHWLAVGIVLGILTASRLPALLIVALCGLEFMRAYGWNLKRIFNKNLLYFLIAPLGFILFALYLSIVQHDALAMFHAYEKTNGWPYQIFDPNIIKTILKAMYQIPRALIGLRPFDTPFVVAIVLPVFSLIILGLSSLYLIIKHHAKFLPLGIAGLLSIVMFTLNSNVVSIHRYILPCLAIYIATALILNKKNRRPWLYVVCFLGVLIQLFLYGMFVSVVFAG